MSDLLDASILVRYLTDDPRELAEVAGRIIDDGHALTISSVTLAEVGWTLGSVYGVSRQVIVDRLVALVRRATVETFPVQKDLVIQALLLCRPSRRVSFADALLWAEARATGAGVYTLDQRFPADGIEVLHAPRGDA